MRLYWDTNTFIRMVETGDIVGQQLGRLLTRALDGRASIVTSELTLAELLVEPLRRQDDELLDAYRDLFTAASRIDIAVVDRPVPLATAQIRADHAPTKLPDAIHVATAELAACTHFVSADRRLPPRPLLRRVSLDVESLTILAEDEY
ncbi:putative nucleic acid-binding protein [Ancylobacter aquaticus]|uniref:Ribonuclease VapC n=1 Tax=Ancylobacter aquaticus TaxID=100 RepID=A0A4R1I5S2_ANCAQ|nr:PIN domain-containing protein [Ancylobacter aquaticus]TCK30697.1 putative nucleic acid-binding protein [Ancylobacter aquaticus]